MKTFSEEGILAIIELVESNNEYSVESENWVETSKLARIHIVEA